MEPLGACQALPSDNAMRRASASFQELHAKYGDDDEMEVAPTVKAEPAAGADAGVAGMVDADEVDADEDEDELEAATVATDEPAMEEVRADTTDADAFDRWDAHPHYDRFQYVACAHLRGVTALPYRENAEASSEPFELVDFEFAGFGGMCAPCVIEKLRSRGQGMGCRILDRAHGIEFRPVAAGDVALIRALRRVVSKDWLVFCKVRYPSAEACIAGVDLRLDVYLANDLWSGESDATAMPNADPAARCILSGLTFAWASSPPSPSPSPAPSTSGRRDRLTNATAHATAHANADANAEGSEVWGTGLPALFSSLPKHGDLVSRNFLLGETCAMEPEEPNRPGLYMLPSTAIQCLVSMLGPTELGCLAGTCRLLHSSCCGQVSHGYATECDSPPSTTSLFSPLLPSSPLFSPP